MPPEAGSLTLPHVRAQLDAGREDFFLYQRLIDLTPSRPRPGILAPEFLKKLEQHRNDAQFLYLYGRSLIGKDTPQAIVYLNRAADAAPKLPWVYTALASIYSSRNFLDEPKLLANLRIYRGLCPANVDGFRYLSKVKGQAVSAEWPGQLRPLLERSRDPRDADLWRLLWAAEFRLTPKDDYPVLRQRIANDVKRLESLPLPHDYKFLLALFDGYNLSGQTDSAAKIDEIVSAQEFHQAYKTWEDTNDIVHRNVGPEAHRMIMQDLAKQSAEWVVKWPSSVNAWETRLNALSYAPGWTKQEMEQAGEEVLKLDAEQEMGWTYIPRKLSVAQTWARNGVRLKDAVRLAEEALAEISLGPEVMSDLTAPPNAAKMAASQMFSFDCSTWDAMATIVDGSAQLKDFDKAESMPVECGSGSTTINPRRTIQPAATPDFKEDISGRPGRLRKPKGTSWTRRDFMPSRSRSPIAIRSWPSAAWRCGRKLAEAKKCGKLWPRVPPSRNRLAFRRRSNTGRGRALPYLSRK